MLFYSKVLSLLERGDLKLAVRVESRLQEGLTQQELEETKKQLKDLGLSTKLKGDDKEL
jgi:hypothetical protein